MPSRRGRLLKAEEHVKHGWYALKLPCQEVLNVLAEDIHGIDEEICGLRTLAHGLLYRQAEASSPAEAARLVGAYSHAAGRLAELIKSEKKLAESGKAGAWSEEFLACMDQIYLEMGNPPFSEAFWKQMLEEEPELAASTRGLVEEIAAVRFVLRSTFKLAMEARKVEEYVHLVEVYGTACHRLAKLLLAERGGNSRVDERLHELVDQAFEELRKELGIGQ